MAAAIAHSPSIASAHQVPYPVRGPTLHTSGHSYLALLMAEYQGGRSAFVVARISGEDALERLRALPEWVKKENFKPVVIDPLGPPLDQ